MNPLRPYPLGPLVTQALAGLTQDRVFDLPRRKFYAGAPDHDLSVTVHGHRAGTALGPAAGPHSQLAQNIALCWLGGARIFELKTVQIQDELTIPRPCIDMATVGYNVEWSQELKLEESLTEYAKAALLVRALQHAGATGGPADHDPIIFDMSVGYDLAGIQHPRVQTFLRGMADAKAELDALRSQLPPALRDLDCPSRLSDTLTLSTFHGCPPAEIERIIEHLQDHHRLHCVVKLNPTLLGPADLRALLHDRLGYHELTVPDQAFADDTRWDQAVDFVGRLGERARARGLGFGVKFTNTLIVENHRDFFPASERQMYLSGPPLHVLAMELVARFRATFGDRHPISFSAGIDKANFADAVALGLAPVTVCSDLLKPGGYGRASAYLTELTARMTAVGATDIPSYTLRAYDQGLAALQDLALPPEHHARCAAAYAGRGDLRAAAGAAFEPWLSAARLRNTAHYTPRAAADPRYAEPAHRRPPRKVGTHLTLFDCLTCDKCIPVCPNAANFTLSGPVSVPRRLLERTPTGWQLTLADPLPLLKKHQLANFADLCNDCGNCDVFCPEDGGPYLIKPRYFSRLADYEARAPENGFHLPGRGMIHGRISQRGYTARFTESETHFTGPDVDVRFDPADPAGTLRGRAPAVLDLTPCEILRWFHDAALSDPLNLVGPLVG